MSGDNPAVTDDLPNSTDALRNAARLLRQAEQETDRELMVNYTDLADKWMTLSATIADRENV